MKILGNEIKPGMIIEHNNDLWSVLKTQHVKPGKGGAFNQVELKSVKKRIKLNERFRSSDSVERAILNEKKFNFLYKDENNCHFMDQANFEQIEINKSILGEKNKLLKENILAMKQFWTEEKGEFHGEFVDFDPAFSWPKPAQRPHPPIILGGETDYTLKRVVDFCDGWLPRPRADIVDGMTRLRRVAEEGGRDLSSISVSVFGAPPEKEKLQSYDELGIHRALLRIPTEDRDTCFKLLDSYMPLLGK